MKEHLSLPNGWEIRILGDVCEIITRGISPIYTEFNELCVLNQKCIRDHQINYNLVRFHDDKAKSVKAERLIQAGDVLVNSTGTGTLGRVAPVNKNHPAATVDSHVTIVRPKKNIFYNSFFGWAMIFIEEEIAKSGEGCGGQTELARSTLKNNFSICYPKSIAQQQRIVAILDEAFTAITKAKTNAEQNLKNAKELFESYLQGVFEKKGEGWEIKTLAEVCEIINGGTPDTTVPKFWNGDNLWITPKDMGKMESIYVDDTLRKITDEGLKNSSAKILPVNSIILSSRAPIGHLAINTRPISTNQGCKGLVPKNEVDTSYLYYFLSKSVELLNSLGTGATFKELSGSKLGTVEIPLPSITEQNAIVQKFNALSAETKKLQAIYQAKINDLEELKKSILQKAFAGELTKAEVAA